MASMAAASSQGPLKKPVYVSFAGQASSDFVIFFQNFAQSKTHPARGRGRVGAVNREDRRALLKP
jgi:hypothetical protein